MVVCGWKPLKCCIPSHFWSIPIPLEKEPKTAKSRDETGKLTSLARKRPSKSWTHTLPLLQRQYRDTTYEFEYGSELYEALLFFEALLPNIPPLRVRLDTSSTLPLLVYTDASFWVAAKRERKRTREEQVLPS